jgi:LytR cell envelope-related transcriptional attenuator
VSDPSGTEDSQSTEPRRSDIGYRSRLERRTAKRAERRRKAATRFWVTAIPVAAVVAVVVVLFAVYGGEDGNESAQSTTTTPAAEPQKPSSLLAVEQEGTVPVVLLVHPRSYGGAVLAMPGITLLKTAAGFKILAELDVLGEGEALAALSEALAVSVETTASVEWKDLRSGMIAAGIGDVPAEVLASEPGGTDLIAQADAVAGAALALFAAMDSEEGAGVWGDLELGGDASGFVDAIAENTSAMSLGGWTAASITGEIRGGAGSEYLEPDMRAAGALLAGTVEQAAVTLKIQDGCGTAGVTEAAGALLESLGYTLLPFSNSDDYPGVVLTRITAAPDAAEEAEQVRARLGVGEPTEDESLESGRIVVVLGTDFVPASSAETEPTG